MPNRIMKTVGPDEPTLSVAEFATAVKVHPMTVYRWVRRELITVLRTPSGGIQIPESTLKAFLTVHPSVTEQASDVDLQRDTPLAA